MLVLLVFPEHATHFLFRRLLMFPMIRPQHGPSGVEAGTPGSMGNLSMMIVDPPSGWLYGFPREYPIEFAVNHSRYWEEQCLS